MVDKVKTLFILKLGYKIIRIDYSQLLKMKYHLDVALERLDAMYISTHKMYQSWLLGQTVTKEEYLFVCNEKYKSST